MRDVQRDAEGCAWSVPALRSMGDEMSRDAHQPLRACTKAPGAGLRAACSSSIKAVKSKLIGATSQLYCAASMSLPSNSATDGGSSIMPMAPGGGPLGFSAASAAPLAAAGEPPPCEFLNF